MIQRFTIAGIVAFWLVMNVALVRLWLYPETSEVLSLPVSHVMKQVFLHEQNSTLTILQNGHIAGRLALQPHRDDANGLRTVSFSGNLVAKLPFLNQQPLNWRGFAEMDRRLSLRDLKLHVFLRATPAMAATTADIDLQPAANTASYTVDQNGTTLVNSQITLDEAGAKTALQALGMDPAMLSQIAAGAKSGASAVTLTARQSEIRIRGERVEVFHLTMSQNASPLMEADISQLGQVLGIKTAFGFSFVPED